MKLTEEEYTELAEKVFPEVETIDGFISVEGFESLGDEASNWYNILSEQTGTVSPEDKATLRDARTRWRANGEERLGDLYLVTPTTVLDPKRLMGGIETFLNEQTLAMLDPIEVVDLNEVLRCRLTDSATAAEVMSIRVVESIVGRWYEKESGKSVRRMTLGSLLKWFTTKYEPRLAVKRQLTLLDYLNMRRNLLAHPRAISGPSNAQTTFMNVCSLVPEIGRFVTDSPAPQSGTDSNAT